MSILYVKFLCTYIVYHKCNNDRKTKCMFFVKNDFITQFHTSALAQESMGHNGVQNVSEVFKNPTIYNRIHWFAGTNDFSTKCLMFHAGIIFFFIISCKNCFNLFHYFFYKFIKIKIKNFECPKSIRNYKKNNAWNIRSLVHKSFVTAN